MRQRTGYKPKLKSERTPEELAETAAWVALRQVTPEDWLQRILDLPERFQGTIARMVWWDFWSDRTVAERWDQFDHWLKWDQEAEDNPISSTSIAVCLRKIGYPEYRIRMRLMAFK